MSIRTTLKFLYDPRVLSILFLGFSSGMPLALTSSTLSAWYAEAGLSLMTIGFLSMIGQPYVYKFIWSPLLDRYRVPYLSDRLGLRRSWMLVAQILLIPSIAGMAFLTPELHPYWLTALALFVAVLSASQDIAINAYQTTVSTPEIRGLISSASVAGYRIAIVVSGALALIMAQVIGWHDTYLIMASLMAVGVITTLACPIPEQDANAIALHEPFWQTFIDPVKEFLSRFPLKISIAIIITIILYKLSEAFALALISPFLLKTLGFSLLDIGTVNKFGGMTASILGGIVGGLWMIRLGLFRSLMLFGFLQSLSNFAFAWLAAVGHNYPVMVSAVLSENFFSGFGNTAFVALLMALCNKQYSAAQYAVLSAVMAIGRVYVGPLAAILVQHWGWFNYYVFSVMIGAPGLVALWLIRKYIPK